jgi:hypothetical protein
MENEICKDIPGYEGLYKISNFGRTKSLRSSIFRKDFQSGKGYRAIQLSDKNSKKEYHYIHRLVALTFLGEPPKSNYVVNHKNLNKSDNRMSNLEWVTPQENMHHAYINGRSDNRRSKRRDNTTGIKGVSSQTGGYQVNLCGKYIGWYKNINDAQAARLAAEKRLAADE